MEVIYGQFCFIELESLNNTASLIVRSGGKLQVYYTNFGYVNISMIIVEVNATISSDGSGYHTQITVCQHFDLSQVT